jgi:hypothetical protein
MIARRVSGEISDLVIVSSFILIPSGLAHQLD